MLPFSISYSGSAWHALITVWVRWYLLQKALRAPEPMKDSSIASLIGTVWVVGGQLVAGTGRAGHLPRQFRGIHPDHHYPGRTGILDRGFVFELRTPSRWVANDRWVLVLCFWSQSQPDPWRPAHPAGVAYWGLQQNQKVEPPGSILDAFASPPPLRNLAALFCLPLVSIALHAFAQLFDLKIHINMVFYLVTCRLGSSFSSSVFPRLCAAQKRAKIKSIILTRSDQKTR